MGHFDLDTFLDTFLVLPVPFPFRNYLPRCSYNFLNKLIDAVTMLKISLVNNFYFVTNNFPNIDLTFNFIR